MPLHVASVQENLLILTQESAVYLGSFFSAMVKDYGLLFVTSNRCIPVKNTFRLKCRRVLCV